jgi:hypothetical protein
LRPRDKKIIGKPNGKEGEESANQDLAGPRAADP